MEVSAHIATLNAGTESLDALPLESLESLVAEYPYFQLGHIALLKAYKRDHPDRFAAYLPLAATYAPDRARLQEIVMEQEQEQVVQTDTLHETPTVEPTVESPVLVEEPPSIEEQEEVWPPDTSLEPAEKEIHDDPDAPELEHLSEPEDSAPKEFTETPVEVAPEEESVTEEDVDVASIAEEDPVPEAIDLPAPSEKHSFTEWLHRLKPPGVAPAPQVESEPTQAETASDEDQEDPLAQQFQAAAYEAGIVREASRQPDPMAPVAEEEDAEEDEPDYKAVEQQARKSVEMNDALLSETLATVFVIQRNYKKAIEVYEKLRLKFPEKSHYFAARIAELQSK